MKKILKTIFLCVSLPVFSLSAENLTQYVNPMIGTDGYGNVYPGAQIPFGGIQISPDTDAKFYDAAAGGNGQILISPYRRRTGHLCERADREKIS